MNFVRESGMKPTVGQIELGRGANRNTLQIHPTADVNLTMLMAHLRQRPMGYTEADPEPRWILIDP